MTDRLRAEARRWISVHLDCWEKRRTPGDVARLHDAQLIGYLNRSHPGGWERFVQENS